MPFSDDESNPTDGYSIPSYPSNARAYRAMNKSRMAVEHSETEGRHTFGFGSVAVRNAISTWEDGAVFFASGISAFGYVMQIRVSGTWENVYPDDTVPNLAGLNEWTAGQFVVPVSVVPAGGSPNTLAVSAVTAPYKYATITADTILSNPSSYTSGRATSVDFQITQDGTGGHALTFGTSYKFPGGAAPTIAQGAGETTLLNLRWTVGNLWLVTIAADIS